MRSKVAISVGVVTLCVGAAYLLSGKPNTAKTPPPDDAHVAIAKLGAIDRVMRLTGKTAARSYSNIIAPMLRGRESGASTWSRRQEQFRSRPVRRR